MERIAETGNYWFGKGPIRKNGPNVIGIDGVETYIRRFRKGKLLTDEASEPQDEWSYIKINRSGDIQCYSRRWGEINA